MRCIIIEKSFNVLYAIVSHCSPPLQEMELLLNQLNNDREIYTFVKRVRKAFVDQAAN
jgi:hypothetical protein